jgi:integrase
VQALRRAVYLKKLPSGAWRVIVQHDGQRASATADTRGAAERRGAELLLALGGTPNATGMTVAELLDLHLHEHPYRATTLDDYQRVRNKLPATFTARLVANVEPVIIDGLYRELDRNGWTPHRIRRAHELISAAYKRAKRRGWAKSIPTRDAELPRVDERDDTTPTVEQVRALLEAAPADLRLFLWLAASSGARRGELCALRWEDIDRTDMVLRIRRAASYTPAAGLTVGDTKTGPRGRRGIPIDNLTLELLDAHRNEQLAGSKREGVGVITPWIFTSDYEQCWRPDFATYRFIALRDSLRLHTVRLHDLRHFVASELMGGITDARTAADHVGHARPSMTSDRYARSIDKRRRDAADELNKRVRGS